jgi:hypothetical protein
MFRSLFHDHLQGSSFILSAFTTFQLPASSFVFFGFVAVCPLFVCVPGIAVCVLTGRALQLFFVSSTCFRLCFRPPSGALDCIYSIW